MRVTGRPCGWGASAVAPLGRFSGASDRWRCKLYSNGQYRECAWICPNFVRRTFAFPTSEFRNHQNPRSSSLEKYM